MSITMGTALFGHEPQGALNVDVPLEGLKFSEPYPRRLRALAGGQTLADTVRARLLHERGSLPTYWFPREDVREGVDVLDPPEGAPGMQGYVHVPFSAADAWLEEDDEQVGHPPDPYHRIDVRRTSREVVVSLRGTELARSTRARVLFETAIAPRWYLPREDVSAHLVPSELQTTCAYKGHASWWSVQLDDALEENVVWSYPEPHHDGEPVRGLLAFLDEQVDVAVDGVRQDRPRTPWSAPRWWEQELRAPGQR